MANIHDVARLSGVHRSTVSRVLTGQGSVSEKSKKKVLDAVRKINYHTNTVASALKSQKKTAVGLLSFWNCSPNTSEAFYQQSLSGIIDEITLSHFHLLLNNIQEPIHAENQKMNFCYESLLAGVILMSPRVKNESDLTFLKQVNIPILFYLYQPENPHYSWIDLDNRKGAQLATDHLVHLGHRRIAYVGGELEYSSNARNRYQGYLDILKKSEIQKDVRLIKNKNFSFEHGMESMRQFLLLPQTQRPTAIFCATDMTAFGIMEVAKEAGLKVPMDISVVGFDDYAEASQPNRELTTIRQPFYEMGKQAVQLLESMAGEKKSSPKHIFIEPKLIIRKSTAPPKSQ